MRKLVALLGACFALSARAQDTLPLLTGTVHLSILQGTVDCDLVLHNVPRIQDYLIRINSGMNIRYFENYPSGYKFEYEREIADSTGTYESNDYWFPASRTGKFLPKSIRFRYCGMYPVVADTTAATTSREDWKGNIAFNGYSVRADGYQSCWYPVLYDVKKQITYDKIRYDIDVDCPDCSTIYVNGAPPVQGPHARLHSDVPRQILLYAGKYPVAYAGGDCFLNPDMDQDHLRSLAAVTEKLKGYYAGHLGIPYMDTITFIQTTPTAPDHAWLFVSYPTIVNIGYDPYAMKSFADPAKKDNVIAFMSHELGHYYYGTYRRFNAALGDMMSEGFAEFLALHATRALISDSAYHKELARKVKALKNFQPTSFATVKDYRNRELYVYYYAPLIFTAIEKEIGEPATWKWLHELLVAPADFTDYAFLLKTLHTVTGDRADALAAKYFQGDQTLASAESTLGL